MIERSGVRNSSLLSRTDQVVSAIGLDQQSLVPTRFQSIIQRGRGFGVWIIRTGARQ